MYKKRIISYFGNETSVAKFLSITPTAVYRWPKIIPEKQAFRLDHLTKGKLKYEPALYCRKH